MIVRVRFICFNGETLLDKQQQRALKKTAHHLKPIVRIGQHGLSEGVVNETKLSLEKHELIKIHIHEGKREERMQMAQELTQTCGATLIHQIGKNFVLYRKQQCE